jgi:streptomycin 6-kinase
MEEHRRGRRQPDGAAQDRYPGFANLDRALEPVEFAAQASVEGRAWIAALPALVDRLCRRWRLQVEDGLAARGYHGVVVPVSRGDERCVLKLTWPAERTVDEARALTAWRGNGAVFLLDADPQAGAQLLERLDATRTLDSLDLRAAAQVTGRLLRRLAIPGAGGGSPPASGGRCHRSLAAGATGGPRPSAARGLACDGRRLGPRAGRQGW